MQYPHWLMVAGAVLVVMKPIDDYESALPAAGWPNWVLDGERVVLDHQGRQHGSPPPAQEKATGDSEQGRRTSGPAGTQPEPRQDIPIAGTAHQAGTARFGTDPAVSVLDLDCKAHESTISTSRTRAFFRRSVP